MGVGVYIDAPGELVCVCMHVHMYTMYICIYKCEYGGKQEKEKEREGLGGGEDCMNEQHADLSLSLFSNPNWRIYFIDF